MIFRGEMANTVHMAEEVKSFHVTQTLPFITHGIPAARSQNPSEWQYVLQKKNGHRNQRK